MKGCEGWKRIAGCGSGVMGKNKNLQKCQKKSSKRAGQLREP
jgi:hypothetical protein